MNIPNRIKQFLEVKKVPYEVVSHEKRDTAIATAQVEHVSSDHMLKVVMVKVKGKNTMVVIPANRMVDIFKLEEAFNTKDISVEEEKDFETLFPDCQRGAMPPLGGLYGLPCYVDETLKDKQEVYFNAGTHEETVKMTMKDYISISQPKIGDYSIPKKKRYFDPWS